MFKKHEPRLMVCCTDGSESSKTAFEMALREFLDIEDHISVLHISDCRKTYLQEKFKVPSIVQNHKIVLLSELPSSRYSIVVDERNDEYEDVRKQMAYQCSHLKADFVFVGNFGRKGKKDCTYRLGNTVIEMTKLCKVPIVIVKKHFQRKKNETKGFNFVCCLDGSKSSLRTLTAAHNLGRDDNDKIYTLTAIKATDSDTEKEALKESITKMIEESGVEAQPLFVDIEEEVPVEKTLEQYVNFSETILFDFVLVGNCGTRAQYTKGYFVGKTADHMVRSSYINPIIVP